MRYKSEGAKAFVQIGDILFTAVAVGTAGNDVSIVLADTKEDGSAEITSVVAGVITIAIEDGVTPAGLIVAAVNEDDSEGGAAELVLASLVGDTSLTAQDAATETNLSSGLDADAEFVVLGGVRGSKPLVVSHAGAIEAGIAVRLKSDNTLSVTLADGAMYGVVLGLSLNYLGEAYNSICRKGLGVPLRLTPGFQPAIGEAVYIDDVTGYANASDSGAVTISNAIFETGMISGEVEQGLEIPVALISMQGGL